MRSPRSAHAKAKAFRSDLSPPERLIWIRLRARHPGLPSFRRQHPFGPYVLDFFCAKVCLAIEIDGQSHDMGDRPQRDLRRDAYLAAHGVKVMRYRAQEVMTDPDGVAQAIFEAATGAVHPPPPLRSGGGGAAKP